MHKILLSLLLFFTTLMAEKDDTYIFEVKGQFAKDLKALFEKYSKDKKIEVKVYQKSTIPIQSVLTSSPNSHVLDGQTLYQKKCASCHGIQGEIGAGAGSRILKNMSAKDIETAMYNYKRDEHFGGSMKMLMEYPAQSIGTTDLIAIIDYIKGRKSSQIDKTENLPIEKSNYLQ